jgi:4-amino-4-deoxy-L-arabinose transferase-like glycosyltransferase
MMFELIPTKLPHYVLPLLPALAILLVKAAAEDGAPGRGRAWRAWALLLLPLPALVLAGLAPAAVALLEPGGPARFAPLFWAAPWLALTLAAALAAVLMARAGRALQAIPVAAAASLLLSVAVYQVAWPALRSIQLSPRLAAAAGASGCADPRMATVGGYNEPSLVFLTRTDLVMTMAAGGAAFMAGEGCRIAFVTAQEDAAFRAEAGKLGVPLRLLTRVEGVNINRAVDRARGTVRVMDIGVYLRDTSRP